MHYSYRAARLSQTHGGFSLVELMVAVSVLAVLLAVGAPSLQALIASSRLATTTNDLVATLAHSRSEAIRLGARVSVCKSVNGTQCATSGDWSQGWIVFADANRTTPDYANAYVNTGETITFTAQTLPTGIEIKGNVTVAQYVSFSADGQSKSLTGAFQAGTIRICSTSAALTNDKRARDLVINSVGRIAIEKPANVGASCPSPT